MIFQIIILGLVALALSLVSVRRCGVLAKKYAVFDLPNERSSHSRPTPFGGGLPIVLLSLLGLQILWVLDSSWNAFSLVAYVIGSLLIALISLLDDFRTIGHVSRLCCHFGCALLLVFGFGFWEVVSVPVIGNLELAWLGLPLTLIWILGLINAYNFMDGIDGLAGCQAIVAGLAWGWIGFLTDQYLVAGLGVLIASSSMGFLVHNWAPARIFMGDVGSVFLGYSFAALPLAASRAGSEVALCGFLVLWPFIFDTSFTLLSRLSRHENIWVAHRSHLYQRLLPLGYSHRFVSILYSVLALIGVVLAWMWLLEAPWANVGIGLLPLLASGLWMFVVYQERKCRRFKQSPSSGHGLSSDATA